MTAFTKSVIYGVSTAISIAIVLSFLFFPSPRFTIKQEINPEGTYQVFDSTYREKQIAHRKSLLDDASLFLADKQFSDTDLYNHYMRLASQVDVDGMRNIHDTTIVTMVYDNTKETFVYIEQHEYTIDNVCSSKDNANKYIDKRLQEIERLEQMRESLETNCE